MLVELLGMLELLVYWHHLAVVTIGQRVELALLMHLSIDWIVYYLLLRLLLLNNYWV